MREGKWKKAVIIGSVAFVVVLLLRSKRGMHDSGAMRIWEPRPKPDEAVSFYYDVKYGTAESLVGISFGDPFDYGMFEERYDGVTYERTDIDDDWVYCFDAEGHRFSGLSAIHPGSYFGLELGQDTKEKVQSIYGKPDEIVMTRKGEKHIYHFWNVDLTILFSDEIISGIEYTATERMLESNPQTGPTDLETALAEGYDTAETIYHWGYWHHADVQLAVPHDENYDESLLEKLVVDYLREQGVDPEQPDGEMYDENGKLFLTYYCDKVQQIYYVVMYYWNYGQTDWKAGTTVWQDIAYCGTYDVAAGDREGSLVSSTDKCTGIVTETQYDEWGMRTAEVSYRSEESFPFPVITEFMKKKGGYLCRDKKMWFFEEAIVYDENGRIESYQGDKKHRYNSMFWYPSDFSYDVDGRLLSIVTETQETDYEYTEYGMDRRASTNFEYGDDGELKEADYWFSEWSHVGTSDSRGSIWYDSEGRMIYNTFYMTHGSHKVFYLYEDGAERPWGIAEWCIQDGLTFDLFEPIER